MCWNAPVSYASLAFGYIMMYLIWTRPSSAAYKKAYDYWNVLFIASFVSMQLGEGLVHQGYNDIGRNIIFWCVVFQPISQCIGGAYFGGYTWLYYLAALNILIIPVLGINKIIEFSKHKHLVWAVSSKNIWLNDLFTVLYIAGVFFPLIMMTPLRKYIILPITMTATIFFSIYKWYTDGSWSSMWCSIAVFYSVIAYYTNRR
jgi:hypothetical protein